MFPVDYVGIGQTSQTCYRLSPLDPAHPYAVINGARTGPEGARPFPNSHHSGGVNVVMCDGSARFLSASVDLNVYAQLVTPSGTRFNNRIAAQAPLSNNDF